MEKRDRIITDLFLSKDFNDCISKMEPAHLRDDLKMEVSLIICEWPDEKIIRLHTEGILNFYVVRIIINQIQSSTSPFFRKYRQFVNEYKDSLYETYINAKELYDDKSDFIDRNMDGLKHRLSVCSGNDEYNDRLTKEQLEDFTLSEIDSLYWYDAALIRMYLKHGTYRAIEEETKIPFISCYKNIQKSLDILRQKALAPKPLFTKEELNFIQNGSKKDSKEES